MTHALLSELSALHKRLCPRQILGLRMGLYAAALLRLNLPQTDKRLYTFVETDGCFVDGITVATGCSLGHRTLRLFDYGKAAATFLDTESARAIRIWPCAESRIRAAQCVPEAKSRWQAQFQGYQVLPFEELFACSEVSLTVSWTTLIGQHGVRLNCAICREEIINQREVTIDGRTFCRSCAGEGYWRQIAPPLAVGPLSMETLRADTSKMSRPFPKRFPD
jgi:formylmethanofuran dehydrogenase subunit E